MPPQDHYVPANGITLHYVDWGGDGPPLVMVHPTGFMARIWDPLAGPLTSRYHVIGVDLRGHGDSDKPEEGHSWTSAAADLHALLRELDIERAVGVGHSAGAVLIAYIESRHPGTFSRAVLIDPVLITPNREGRPASSALAEGARKRRMVWESADEMFESYRARPPFDTWRPEILRLYVEYGSRPLPDGRRELKCPGHIEAQHYEHGPSSIGDPYDMLSRVACPVLLMRGERTSLTEAVAEQAVRSLPAGTLVTIPNTTHFVPMEAPEAVLAEIERFLSD